jgi:hypothetical protein
LEEKLMDPHRRREIEKLYDAAIEQPSQRRAAFLAQVCGDDVRREVERLITTIP